MNAGVVVVGGGISGLVAAYRLQQLGVEIVVLEAEAPGGKIRTDRGVELGPDSFLARDQILVELCKELGLEDDLVEPVGFGAQVWLEDGLRRLPASTHFGVPLDADDAAAVLSPDAVERVRGEASMPVALDGDDISVGEVIEQRFGAEVLERMVDPILAGTRAGDPTEISLRSALPHAWGALSRGEALTVGLRIGEAGAPPPFFGLRSGMSSLVEALGAKLDVRSPTRATGLRRDGTGYVVDAGDDSFEASAVIMALPAPAASGLLGSIDSHLAHAFGHFEAADVAIAALTFDTELELPEGSGLLVPRVRRRTLTGATWYSRKWPHAAPPGRTIVRCFAGRSRDDAIPDDDPALVAKLHADLGDALGPLPQPVETRIARWRGGLPIYAVGHERRLRAIDERLEPRLAVIGAAYRGSGLPDCARQAFAAADSVAAALG